MTILAGRHHVQYGSSEIEYELTFSARKTLAIHIHPDRSIVVDAPIGTELSSIEYKVIKRGGWILRQQRELEQYPSASPLPRRYVSGEAYRYLGRQYRLKVIEDTVERVTLSRGYLTVSVGDPAYKPHIARCIEQWYHSHAKRVFLERLAGCFPRVQPLGMECPEMLIRPMKARWGSCSAAGRITLNVKLIQVPKDLIDYVLLHELCHLKEHNHTSAFYALLDSVLPDWRERRRRLNAFELT
jgi:predicted metal-dependent hydrolase